MIEWRQAEASDIECLSHFECYEAPKKWAPNTPHSIRKNYKKWLRRVEHLVRELKPPYYPEQDALVCSLEGDGRIDGVFVSGTPHLQSETGELYIYVLILARSLRAKGCSIGQSAMERLEEIADNAASTFLDIRRVYLVGNVHVDNHACQRLMEFHGWTSRGLTKDPDYAEWAQVIDYQD